MQITIIQTEAADFVKINIFVILNFWPRLYIVNINWINLEHKADMSVVVNETDLCLYVLNYHGNSGISEQSLG